MSVATESSPVILSQRFKDIVLRHLGPSYSAIDEIARQAEKDLGFKIVMEVEKDNEIINRAINHPETLDIYDFDHWSYKIVLPEGVLQGISINKYNWWDKTLSVFTTGTLPGGGSMSEEGTMPFTVQYLQNPESTEFAKNKTDTICMVPHMMNADTLGIRIDLIDRPIMSWSELINPEFSGSVSLVNIPDIGIMDAAMAFESMGVMEYGNKGDMTRDEIDRTIELLIELKDKGHFHSFWSTFEESVESFSSGEVVIQSMWSPAISEVSSRGIICDYPLLIEGYRGWSSGLGIMRHVDGDKLEAAYEYLNWYNSGWVGAFIAKEGYYSSIPDNAKLYLTENEWNYWYEGKPATDVIKNTRGEIEANEGDIRTGGSFLERISNIACWNTVMKENDYLIKRWKEFINK